jgi:transcriptional regulator with XRE-family HTH domain
MQPANSLGEVIHRIRKSLGLTTTQLGDKLGVNNATISRYETGHVKPSLKILAGLFLLAKEGPDKEFLDDWITLSFGRVPFEVERVVKEYSNLGRVVGAGALASHRWKLLMEEIQKLVDEGRDVHMALVGVVRLYRESRHDPRVVRALSRFVVWLEAELVFKPAVRKKANGIARRSAR